MTDTTTPEIETPADPAAEAVLAAYSTEGLDPAVLEVTKALVLDKFLAVTQMGADTETTMTEIAALIVGGKHEVVIAAHAAKMLEQLAAAHAQAAIQKRTTEEQIAAGREKLVAAQNALGVAPDDGARNPS